ncbi:unnamed protein product [Oppiella nova]|uniref:Glucose-6-phosphate 1-dehydrogenase n=1 Tax=Oppiella nova TaxID=334625 RepID=A0A7R9LJ19_9ACAR|nr:unnamed protein product [Oppiella nova]CAG2164103.1 unnamed protein product [Oppiella nova]
MIQKLILLYYSGLRLTNTYNFLHKNNTIPIDSTLYKTGQLPKNFQIAGFAHNENATVAYIRSTVDPYVVNTLKDSHEKQQYEDFWKIVTYNYGDSTATKDYAPVVDIVDKFETGKTKGHRIVYFALPPDIFANTSAALKSTLLSKTGWTRLVIEKPFGRDSESSKELSDALKSQGWTEDQIYRIDHYLGKEMVQNILPIRFGNNQLEPTWNRQYIANVEILFKEPFGTQGRGKYFEKYGIIRDVVQNHLLQVLTLVAMERPDTLSASDIRGQKLKLLQSMANLKVSDVVLGQYVGNPKGVGEAQKGYTDDKDVPKNSTTSTFSVVVLHIDNDRWKGVPFFIRSGKATDESRVEVRVQYKPLDKDLFGGQSKRDMTIFRIQPNEAVYQKFNVKRPVYYEIYSLGNAYLPDAYERLLMDVLNGIQSNFVGTDELAEAWRVFTPALHAIDDAQEMPHEYVFGAQTFKEADDLEAKYGLIRQNN